MLEVSIMYHVEKTSLKWCASSHLYGKLILFYSGGLRSGAIFPKQTPPASAVCHRPSSPAADARRENAAFIQIESGFPLTGGNVNVSFTPVLSFIMIKQLIPGERGGKRPARSGSIHRLSCFIHTLVILYHAPLSGRQEAGWH